MTKQLNDFEALLKPVDNPFLVELRTNGNRTKHDEFIALLFNNKVDPAIDLAREEGFPEEISAFIDHGHVRKLIHRHYTDYKDRVSGKTDYLVVWKDAARQKTGESLKLESDDYVTAYHEGLRQLKAANPQFEESDIMCIIENGQRYHFRNDFIKDPEVQERLKRLDEIK